MATLVRRDRGVFRASIKGMADHGRLSRQERRQLLDLADDEATCDLIYDECVALDEEKGGVVGQWEPTGKFLDRLEKWAKFAWENREAILAFTQKIIAIFVALFAGV